MASSTPTSSLVNPLAYAAQLGASGSQLDGIPADLETSVKFASSRLIQVAGVLLRLPQDVIAQAIIIFTRFWVGPDGGSLRDYGAQDIAVACLYLVTKLSAHPKSPRAILNVFAYLSSRRSTFADLLTNGEQLDPEIYYLSEDTYYSQRSDIMKHEAIILRTLGFQLHVALPYTLCINYLQALEVFHQESGKALASRACAHLNTTILSPQLLHVTHQPPALATAAIYLAAREVGVKLPEEEWWEVFDTDREELGFLVVAMTSMDGFALEEKRKWGKRKVPLTVDELQGELESRRMLNGQE